MRKQVRIWGTRSSFVGIRALVLAVAAGLIPRYAIAEAENRIAFRPGPSRVDIVNPVNPVNLNPNVGPTLFEQINEDGFGQCLNSYSWSMMWFKENLYVGTNKGSFLGQIGFLDPAYDCHGTDPDIDPAAEIWRYSPQSNTWDLVFRSVTDVPIYGQPGVFTARDNGFRDLMAFTEADGTEALYAAGVIYPFLNDPRHPRILRSTDGVNWEAVPQDPGTFLGHLPNVTTFRAMASYKGRFYITAGSIIGEGVILESSNPAGGNDNFRQVSPPGMLAFELITWNDYLYVGTGEDTLFQGFQVVKTDATPNATPYYDFATVVPDGAYGRTWLGPNSAILSMNIYGGRLYAGGQTDLIRINPDDTWELVVGDPRQTPQGPMYPLSGLGQGFGNFFTGHLWRMEAHEDSLYVGTWDLAVHLRILPLIGPLIDVESGFDLWKTDDGVSWSQITRNGLGSKFNPGVRGLESTPAGLFLGTTNPYDGTQVYRAQSSEPPPSFTGQPPATLAPPHRLEAESQGGDAVLSWEPSPGAKQFRILRATHVPNRELGVRELPASAWLVGSYTVIGTTLRPFYRDNTTVVGKRYNYYVEAVAEGGQTSEASNMVMVPSLAPAVTFDRVQAKLKDFVRGKQVQAGWSDAHLSRYLAAARALAKRGDALRAQRLLEAMLRQIKRNPGAMKPFAAEDLEMMVGKLLRRVTLAQSGVIRTWDLVFEPK